VRYDKEREFRRMFDPPDCLAIALEPASRPRPVEGDELPNEVELDLQEMLR
jgi:hypothetical protein